MNIEVDVRIVRQVVVLTQPIQLALCRAGLLLLECVQGAQGLCTIRE